MKCLLIVSADRLSLPLDLLSSFSEFCAKYDVPFSTAYRAAKEHRLIRKEHFYVEEVDIGVEEDEDRLNFCDSGVDKTE